MPRKSNKKNSGILHLGDPAVQRKIESDFEKIRQQIKEKVALVNQFELLIEKKVTVGYCTGCKHLDNCAAMRMYNRFVTCYCELSFDDSRKLFETFAQGINIVEYVTPAIETFSGN